MSGNDAPPGPPGGSDASSVNNSNGAMVIGVAVTGIVTATVAVALRVYTRKFILKQMWIDDYMAIMSWVSILALGITNFLVVRDGLGTPPTEGLNLLPLFQEMYAGLVFAIITSFFTKLTFFFQFYRIVRHTYSRLRIFYIVVMSIIGTFTAAQIFVTAIPCVPMEAFWDRSLPGKCNDEEMNKWMMGVGSLTTDFIILLLPTPVLWRLRLPIRQKLAVVGIFAIGSFACTVSILKISLKGPGTTDGPPPDPSPNIAWTMAEVAAGILAASLSTLRPLLSRWLPSWREITTHGTAHGSSKRTPGSSNHMQFSPSASNRVAAPTVTSAISRGGTWMNLSDTSSVEMGMFEDPGRDLDKTAPVAPGKMKVAVTREFEVTRT